MLTTKNVVNYLAYSDEKGNNIKNELNNYHDRK